MNFGNDLGSDSTFSLEQACREHGGGTAGRRTTKVSTGNQGAPENPDGPKKVTWFFFLFEESLCLGRRLMLMAQSCIPIPQLLAISSCPEPGEVGDFVPNES
ncbi:hypothetical protein H1C71_014782 [Ictidomys tridecemlineatus]|nr:hypothetical protein H1C71_014782 [Ictidomys tridecemlineatus]